MLASVTLFIAVSMHKGCSKGNEKNSVLGRYNGLALDVFGYFQERVAGASFRKKVANVTNMQPILF